MDEFLDKYIFPRFSKFVGRSKVTKDGFPVYSASEDIFNTISHVLGIFIGFGMFVISFFNHTSFVGMVGGMIFGVTLIILYSASSVYHGTPEKYLKEKRIFRVMDHCSIFILIAGTCTPFVLKMIYATSDETEWIFYAVIWIVALIGIALLSIDLKKYKSIATIMYIFMGFAIVARTDLIYSFIGAEGIGLFLAGGVVYLIGFLFYGLGSKRQWMHGIFHVLCIVGSMLHCVCIANFIV